MSHSYEAGWMLAVDFGTSFTTAAMTELGDEAEAQVVEVENSRYLPSVVCRDEAGQLLTGRAAARQAVVFPERAERVPKRALMKGDQVLLGGHPVSTTVLAAAVLGRVHAEAVRFHGGQLPATVVLTYPALWDEASQGRLKEAADLARITDPVLISEPVAAAWWYARPSPDSLVGVFDLGGGTLDTAVLRESGGKFEIAGEPGGDAALGGEDFDELLFGRVSDLVRERDEPAWADLFGGDGAQAWHHRALLRGDVTAAKESLSEHLTHDLAIAGFAEGFRLTRPELEELIGAKVDAAVVEMRSTITAAETTPEQLREIYLTGGSSRIPAIADRLATGLGVLPQLRDDPKAVVALGALTAARAGEPPWPLPGPGPVPSIRPRPGAPVDPLQPLIQAVLDMFQGIVRASKEGYRWQFLVTIPLSLMAGILLGLTMALQLTIGLVITAVRRLHDAGK